MPTVIRALVVTFIAIFMLACRQGSAPETDNNVITSSANPVLGSANDLSVDHLIGRWVLTTFNGMPLLIAEGNEPEAWIEFGRPCYEVGDGHCNQTFDGGWEPLEPRRGRLSLRGYSGCNWFGGEAKLVGQRLVAKPITSTERACEHSNTQEVRIQMLLSEESVLIVSDEMLEISSTLGDRLVAIPVAPQGAKQD